MAHTVLCIEDEQDTGDLLQQILEGAGYAVLRATDGRQAMGFLETIQPPKLILLDIVVPYANGFELLAAFRRHPDWKSVPIIMVSADYYEPDIQRALAAGATAYVVKKPGLQDLVQTVNQVLSASASEGAAEPAAAM